MTSSPENSETPVRSLARDSVGTTLTYAALFLLGILIFVLNCRILGPMWRGVLGLIMIAPGIVLKIGNFGFDQGMVVIGGKEKELLPKLAATGLLYSRLIGYILIGLLLGFMFGFPIQFWRMFQELWNPLAFTVISIAFPIHLMTLIVDATIYAEDRIAVRNTKEILVNVVMFVAILILVFVFNMKLMGIIGAYVIANTFSLVYGWYLCRDKVSLNGALDFPLISRAVKLGFPVSLALFASYIMLPVMMIQLSLSLHGDQALALQRIGFFSVAYMMVDRILPVTRSVAFALLPKITSGTDEGAGELAAKASRHTLIISFLLFVVLVIFMKPIIAFLLGQRFMNVVVPFAIMAPGGIALSVSGVWAANLLARHRPLDVAFAGIAGVFVALICSWVGFHYMPDGREVLVASISVVIGNLVAFIIMLPAFCRSGHLSVRDVLVPTLDDFREWKRIPGFIFDMIRPKRS